jgi:hypothetical protein
MTLFSKCSAVMVTVVLIFSGLPGAAAQSGKNKGNDDAEQRELYAYVLTMDKIHKLEGATRDMQEWEKKNPQAAKTAKEEDEKRMENAPLSERAKLFDAKMPEAAAILRKNGLTTREYFLIVETMMQAAILVSVKKSGQMAEYSKEATALVNPANLTFVEQHWDELQKLNVSKGAEESRDSEEKP